jgi:glycerol-3-phosphate dehydrogenase (NAD(P)+)
MGEVFEETLPNPVAFLSGPNFALEIIQNKPAATTIGCADPFLGERIIKTFAHKNFRPYLNSDMVGVQIGGAVKNVLAIACGIVRARDLGENAVASLITRGLHEIKTLGMGFWRRIGKRKGKNHTTSLYRTRPVYDCIKSKRL